MTDKKYEKKCVYCGAEVYSDSKERDCYKCCNRMTAKLLPKKISKRR